MLSHYRGEILALLRSLEILHHVHRHYAHQDTSGKGDLANCKVVFRAQISGPILQECVDTSAL